MKRASLRSKYFKTENAEKDTTEAMGGSPAEGDRVFNRVILGTLTHRSPNRICPFSKTRLGELHKLKMLTFKYSMQLV